MFKSIDYFSSATEAYTYIPVPVFRWLGIPQFSTETFALIFLLLGYSLLMASIGIFTRMSLLVSVVTWFLAWGSFEGYIMLEERTGDSYNHSSVFLVLVILLFTKSINAYEFFGFKKCSVPRSDEGEALAVKILLGIIYFCSFYNKMRFGFPWADGFNQQAVLFRKAIQYNAEFTLMLSKHHYVAMLGGITTLWLEGTFIVGQFIKRIRWGYIFGGLGFHMFNYYTMQIGFLYYFCFVYFIFLYELIPQKISSRFFSSIKSVNFSLLR